MTFIPIQQPAPDDLRIQDVKSYTVTPSPHEFNHPLLEKSVPLAGQDLAMPDIYMGTCLFFSALQNSAVGSLSNVDAVSDILDVGLKRLVSHFPAASAHFIKIDGVWNIRYTGDGIPVSLATSDRELGSSYLGREGRIDSDVLPRGFNVSNHSDPAFAVKITRFACGSIALGTSVHHWICDYAGYYDIMVNLSLALSDSTHLPARDHSRDLGALISGMPSEEIPICDWFVRQTGAKVWESGEFALSPDSVTNVMLHFAPESLVQLKFETIRSMRGKDWVSTNDTLAALLWSSLTAARGLKGSGASKAVLTVDGRRFVSNSEVYVGNVHTMHHSRATLDVLCSNTPSSVLQVAQTLRRDLQRLSPGKMASIIRLQDADLTSSFMPNYKPFFGHDVLISNLTKYDWSSLNFGKLRAPTYVSVITSTPVQAGPFRIEGSEGSVFIQNAPVGFVPERPSDPSPVHRQADGVKGDGKFGGLLGGQEREPDAAREQPKPTDDQGIRTQISNSLSKPGVIAIVGIRTCDVDAFTTLPHLLRYSTVLP